MLLNINAGNNSFPCFPVCRKWNSVAGWKGGDPIRARGELLTLSLGWLVLNSSSASSHHLQHVPTWCFSSYQQSEGVLKELSQLSLLTMLCSFCWAIRECGNGCSEWNWDKCSKKVPWLSVSIQARASPTQPFFPTHVVGMLHLEHQLFWSADLFLWSCTACCCRHSLSWPEWWKEDIKISHTRGNSFWRNRDGKMTDRLTLTNFK